ncbi:MAG: 4Fe-4S dicluster domain-containing protein [Chloroflexi bacterium]|nr:4Fe-4S dicluster domain-containing protein [Chloroflexota bacterium]
MNRVYVNEQVCMGCGLCQVYCQAEHSMSKDIIKAFNRDLLRPLPGLRVERKGPVCFPVQCQHCDEAWCVYSCLTGAMHRDMATGAVVVDRDRCVGCWTCIVACPYGALVRNTTAKVVAKCDLCPEREVPVCVANCPNEALMVGEDRCGSPNWDCHRVEGGTEAG